MTTRAIGIALVGDSDIARWPSTLLPFIESPLDGYVAQTTVSGHSGATLEQVVPYVSEAIDATSTTHVASFVIVCAGENDIGNGIPLVQTETAFQSLLNVCRTDLPTKKNAPARRHLIFLGPKLEPWLVHDMEARKSYVRMSQCFERICRNVNGTPNIHYIDCLTLFCGASARQPGALWGGKAMAQPQYFDADQLHLSDDGYRIWQSVVEATIRQILSNALDV